MNTSEIQIIEKLQLQPADIVVVTLSEKRGNKAAATKVFEELRKLLPRGQRVIVKYGSLQVEKLSELLTPEDLHQLNLAMDKKLLAASGVGLPLQERGA